MKKRNEEGKVHFVFGIFLVPVFLMSGLNSCSKQPAPTLPPPAAQQPTSVQI